MATLEQYQRHLEKFGAELLVETAVHDLSTEELGQLKALVDSMERVYRFKAGRWAPKRQVVRQCEHCGLDLPQNAHPKARYHPHCRRTAQSQRYRARGTAQGDKAAPTRVSASETTRRRPAATRGASA
jgi:hypothetical protein